LDITFDAACNIAVCRFKRSAKFQRSKCTIKQMIVPSNSSLTSCTNLCKFVTNLTRSQTLVVRDRKTPVVLWTDSICTAKTNQLASTSKRRGLGLKLIW